MILNMPVHNGATNNTATNVTEGQKEYTNFLKRKFNDRNEMENNAASCSHTTNYNENIVNSGNNWKKRHIDQLNEEQQQENHNKSLTTTNYSSPVSKQYKQNDLNNDGQESSAVGSFNILANHSSFINDLFAYDANLLVPVALNSLSDSVSRESITFSTPSTVSANAKSDFDNDNNGEHWQASDLLELDHRYNSALQMEISQLNPTVNLKHTEENSNIFITNHTSSAETLNHQFVLPQNPITTKRINTVVTSPQISCSSSSSTDHIEQDCDFEDKNLSWLLNFKFDEFPHLNPDVTALNNSQKSIKTNNFFSSNPMNTNSNTFTSDLTSSASQAQGKSNPTTCATGTTSNGSTVNETLKSPKISNKTGKKFEELVMEVTSELEVNDMVTAENVVIEETLHRAPKKPPFTYTELIEYALEDKGELTVSGIYQWISDRFPYYKSNDDRWKNSVRHNLSINPHFRKGHKAPQGAGHLWTISSGDSAENVLAWEHKKQRLDLFFKMESLNRERLQQHHQKQQQEKLRNQSVGQQDLCSGVYDEAAIAAANIQQQMLQQNHNNNDDSIQNQNSLQTLQEPTTNSQDLQEHMESSTYNDLLSDEELRKTAGQILNGIHREVEVQSVNQTLISTYQDVLLDNDYLNPIHKDVVVNESGLSHSATSTISPQCHNNNHSSSTGPYYVTEIDPLELGIQMSGHHHHNHSTLSSSSTTHNQHHHHPHKTLQHVGEESEVSLFIDELNLNYFTYNPNNDIVA